MAENLFRGVIKTSDFFIFIEELVYQFKTERSVTPTLVTTITILGCIIVINIAGWPILSFVGLITTIILVLVTCLMCDNVVTTIFELYELKLKYISWLVDETFVQKNIYIDSNYFLTNDATKGIEKFSDLVVPWLVDNGDIEE